MVAPLLRVSRARLKATAPSRPETDDAVGREKDDRQEPQTDQQPKPIAVEAERDEDVEGEGLGHRVNQRADEGADRIADAADDRDDEDIDRRRDADGAGRDFAIAPDQENAAQSG